MQTSVVPIKKVEVGPLTMDALMWLEERGISSVVAEAAGIGSGRAFFRKLNKEADAVGFVYRHKDNDYAVKWRCIEDKAFTQTGSAQTLYLADKCKVGEPVIITEGECFPGDAEIMTPGGWVRFDSYIGGPVAQWDHGTISFVEPLARVQKPFTGNLVELSVRGYHSLTTPGHRIPRIKKRDGSLQFVQADSIPSNIDSIPRVGVLNGPGIPLTDEQIAFAIAVSADSKVDIRKNTGWKKAEEDRYLHFGFKKERKIDRILELVSDLGLSPLVTSFIDQKDVGLSRTYLSMPCPDWVPGRLLPFEWIGLATQRQREFMLAELRHWDGNGVPNRNQEEYSTKYIENALWVQTLCHTTGRCSSIISRQNQHGNWFKVSILHGKSTTTFQALKKNYVAYTGDVFCVTVPAGAIMVRQNGKITVSGNCDTVSFWQAGMAAASIPSGAIEANTQDDASRLKWMAHHDELLAQAPDIYLAVDADGPGQTTANELARRLGKAKCWKVSYPAGCKDANDVLVKHGPDALRDCIKNAVRWPIEGVASASDYLDRVVDLYRRGLPPGLSTGFQNVDEFFTLNPGNLVVVTGIPNSGKSPFIDSLLVNAMKLHDWRVAFASFESPPAMHLARLAALKTGRPFGDGPTPRMNEATMLEAMAWLNERVTLLTHEGVMPTPESLIERFETAVRRMGVKACVVDPFNFVKLNAKEGGGVDTAAIGEMLAKFKMFAERAEVVFFVIAHPAKPMGQSSDWVPGGYSISHSAEWYNRPDFGLTIHRSKEKGNEFHVWKAKWSHQGKAGWCGIKYVPATGGFSDNGSYGDLPDDPF